MKANTKIQFRDINGRRLMLRAVTAVLNKRGEINALDESKAFEVLLREKCLELIGTTDPAKLEKIVNNEK